MRFTSPEPNCRFCYFANGLTSDVVETVTSETETWLKFRDETETETETLS